MVLVVGGEGEGDCRRPGNKIVKIPEVAGISDPFFRTGTQALN